jgi:hypothetical protein
MKITKYICLSFIIICFSCKKGTICDCFKSTGSITTENRNLTGSFSDIYISQKINLILTQAPEVVLKVESGSNLLPSIITNVEDGILYISDNNKCNWVRKLDNHTNVYLSLPKLTHIRYSAYGNVTTTNTFNVDTLTIDVWDGAGEIEMAINANNTFFRFHTGPASLIATGNSKSNYLYSNAQGMMHCENLITESTFVHSSGTGDCYIRVENDLGYNILDVGNIYYYGDPVSVSGTNTGKGQIIKL